MIQIINYSGKVNAELPKDVVVSKISSPESIDMFDIVFVDYNSKDVWCNHEDSSKGLNMSKDIFNLNRIIQKSEKAKVIIILPQNLEYRYHYYYDYTQSSHPKRYLNFEELKNMAKIIVDDIFYGYKEIPISIYFENTRSEICGEEADASFCFNNSEQTALVHSIKSNKITAIELNSNLIITTLKLDSYDMMLKFAEHIWKDSSKNDIEPDWMEEIKMFDDNRQFEIIRENNDIIKASQNNINDALKCIEKNKRYKSILYTNGDELVDVVFDILGEMLGCNLHDFVDKKKEDFSFKRENVVYIGEIKGISSNVKSQNIAQLEFHHQGFSDEHPEIDDSSLRQLLIINHQRSTAPQQRDPVDKTQIALAEKYGSLIVETSTLLRLFEKYKNKDITREQCFELFEKRGLLSI